MAKVNLVNETGSSINEERIRKDVDGILTEHDAPKNAEVDVAIVPHEKIVEMAMTFLNDTREEAEDHPVLSFPTEELEGPFVFPPDGEVHLGEIVVSYKKAKEQARKNETSVDEEIAELACHGALHIMGIHHE